MSVRYWIAQHISDLFRKEPRNIGVFVEVNERAAARFFGETDGGQLDGRKLRSFPYPDVYRQWVEYWRSELTYSSPGHLVETSGSHYRVIEGGEVDGTEGDTVEDVLNYLYALLISEGGFVEAIGGDEEVDEAGEVALTDEVARTFHNYQLLDDVGPLITRHPIRRNVPISGARELIHEPAFVQRNATLYIMETVDFTIRSKQRSRERAGWSAYMFNDVKEQEPGTSQAIAIVKITDSDRQNEHVANGLAMLNAEADEIVNWLEPAERERFLQARKAVALAE